jgi:DNA-binding LacI/PurR family transcriptional regulator
MAFTIKDIAKMADVSPSTVSRVIDGNPRISSETSEKVKKVMQKLDYHPNMLARSLARKNTKIVGTLIPGTKENAFKHPFFPEILRGITSQANACGYNILISSAATSRDEMETIWEFAKSGIAEGLILTTSRHNDEVIRGLLEMSFPFVLVGDPEGYEHVTWVNNNNVEAGYRLTEHLIANGCTKIAFLGLSDEYLVLKDRFEGYRQALAAHGIGYDEDLVVRGAFMGGEGGRMMEELLARDRNFTGVIAADDYMAFDAIKVLNRSGIRVPEDVLAAGFNNIPLSDYFTPTLTSVDINAYELGEKAFQLIQSKIEGKDSTPENAIVGINLVIRESTSRRMHRT